MSKLNWMLKTANLQVCFFCPSTHLQCQVQWKLGDLTCLQPADCFLVVTGTLGMKVAARLHGLWTAALGEATPSVNSISQQSGGSRSLMAWKSSFQFWMGGVAMSVRYSLLKNCHITNRASVDPGACWQAHAQHQNTEPWSTHTTLKYTTLKYTQD